MVHVVNKTSILLAWMKKKIRKGHDGALIEMKTYSKIAVVGNVDTNDIIDNVEHEYHEIKQYIKIRDVLQKLCIACMNIK